MKVMLWAKLKKRQKILFQATSYVEHKGAWDADALHEAMGEVCRALDIARPLVLQKHVSLVCVARLVDLARLYMLSIKAM